MYYIYKLINEDGDLLYIGKTTNINSRVAQHNSDRHRIAWKSNIAKIEVAEVRSESDLEIYETYYINKLKPIYNTSKVYKDSLSVELPELNFYNYNKSKDLNEILKSKDSFLGIIYKIYITKGLNIFKCKAITSRLGLSKSMFYRLVNYGMQYNLIEKVSDGEYKISENFIKY